MTNWMSYLRESSPNINFDMRNRDKALSDVFPNAGTEIGVDLYELYLGLAGQENRTARPSPAESPRGKTPKQHQQNSRHSTLPSSFKSDEDAFRTRTIQRSALPMDLDDRMIRISPPANDPVFYEPEDQGGINDTSGSNQDLRCWDHGCNGRVFTTMSNLTRHRREHSNVRPSYHCPQCGAYFSRSTARNTHVENQSCTRIRRYSNGRQRPRATK